MNPLLIKSEPPGWGFYQNMRPNTKRPDTIWYLVFLRPPGEKGLEQSNAARTQRRRRGLDRAEP